MTNESEPLLLTGASGLIGRAVSQYAPSLPLPRSDPGNGSPWWEPNQGVVHDLPEHLGPVVHLAGENIANGRWTKKRRERLWNSRVEGTRVLVEALLAHPRPPPVLIMASGISYYGNQADTRLTEESPPGSGFLAELSQAWEAAASPVRDRGIRLVLLRLGVVLAPNGGALAKMLPTARLGLGASLGSGKQWMPWIHIDDVVRTILWAAGNDEVIGPYNLVAPECVSQTDFARALSRTLARPCVMKVPASMLRLMVGQMAEETVLASHRAEPKRLLEEGFQFSWPQLSPALKEILAP